MKDKHKRALRNHRYYFIIVANGNAVVFGAIELHTELDDEHFNVGNYFDNKYDADIIANQINSFFIYNKSKYKH